MRLAVKRRRLALATAPCVATLVAGIRVLT
jgi:hypothetical protein